MVSRRGGWPRKAVARRKATEGCRAAAGHPVMLGSVSVMCSVPAGRAFQTPARSVVPFGAFAAAVLVAAAAARHY